VRADYLKAREAGEICWRSRHLADVIASHPDERILIVTHKRDERKRFDHRAALRQDLTMLGVDLGEKLEQPDGSKLERFVWMTWGRVTGRNDARTCSVVYLASVMMRDRARDLLPSALGQLDDVGAEISEAQLRDLEQSEAAHEIYQAVSRGCAREAVEGQARACDVYVVHFAPQAINLAKAMMPGVVTVAPPRVKGASEHDGRVSERKTEAALAIAAVLEAHEGDEISTSQLKAKLPSDLPLPTNRKTATDWVNAGLESAGWVRSGKRWTRICWDDARAS
jgi:hypothetical protein